MPRTLSQAVLAGSVSALLWMAGPLHAQDTGELRALKVWEIQSLEPAQSGFDLRSLGVTESIVAATNEGEIIPGLAEKWQASEDGLTWQFDIREGATFHDGTPVTGAGVAASYETLLPETRLLSGLPLESISAEGQVVTFTLSEPFGSFLPYLLDPSAPVLAPASFEAGKVTQLLGTGPFRVAGTELPRSILLERNDDYWGEVAAFERVRVDMVQNPVTRVNMVLAGEVDIASEIPPASVARINASGEAGIVPVVMARHVMLMLNAGKPQFETADLRRAMSLAIDRTAIAAAVFGDADLAATQYFPPVAANWHSSDLAPLTKDLDAANRILDEAGWERGTDGIRVKDGIRFAGSIRTFPERAYLPVVSEILQQQFAAIGYDLTLDIGDWSRIPEGQRDGTLDLALGIRTMMNIIPDPIARLEEDFASDVVPSGATGATNWKNQELRDAVAAYQASPDDLRRAASRQAIIRILHEELPVIPIVWTSENYAISPRLDGFPINALMGDWRLNEINPAR